MQNTHIWSKLNLYWLKVIFAVIVMVCAGTAHAQIQRTTRWVQKNNPNYDDRKLTYGFLIGLHTSTYQLK
jgi:hypothetical protein